MTQDNEFGDQAPDDSSPNKIEDANTHGFNNQQINLRNSVFQKSQ